MVCHRKGSDGEELKGGEAGCKDPVRDTLRVLSKVKELHFLGLRAASLNVVGIVAASSASIASFVGETKAKTVEMFAACEPECDTYEDMPIFTAPHPKFVSPTCVNNK
eukprot:1829976-Prymnesium_polylepis.1